MSVLLVTVLCYSLLIPSTVSQSAEAVQVYLFTAHPANGITDQASKDRDRSVKNIAGRLKRDKAIKLVPSRDGADVIVEVAETIVTRSTGTERDHGILGKTKDDEWLCRATLRFGDDYSTEMRGQHLLYAIADVQVADGVKDWIKENRERILTARVPRR